MTMIPLAASSTELVLFDKLPTVVLLCLNKDFYGITKFLDVVAVVFSSLFSCCSSLYSTYLIRLASFFFLKNQCWMVKAARQSWYILYLYFLYLAYCSKMYFWSCSPVIFRLNHLFTVLLTSLGCCFFLLLRADF